MDNISFFEGKGIEINNKTILRMREFKRFENVSILYADICNFTPLTTTLEPYQLVQTLNDLFGKFDDAAEVRIIETN